MIDLSKDSNDSDSNNEEPSQMFKQEDGSGNDSNSVSDSGNESDGDSGDKVSDGRQRTNEKVIVEDEDVDEDDDDLPGGLGACKRTSETSVTPRDINS